MTEKTPDNVCPRCGGGIPNDVTPGAYVGALSRYDNLTEVCSECGHIEAMLDLMYGGYRDGGSPWLHPDNPDRPWFKVPKKEAT